MLQASQYGPCKAAGTAEQTRPMYPGPEVDRDARSPLHGSYVLHPPCEGETLWRMKQLSN